jgi:glutamine synthetase
MIYDADITYQGEEKMRTLVDLGDAQIEALDELSKKEKRSRAALIRQAIDDYLAKRRSKKEGDAFGLWGKRKVDGLAYQEKVRSEW